MKRLDRSEIIFKIVSYVVLTVFALCCLYPLLFVLANSISHRVKVDANEVSIIPQQITFEAYQDVFTNKQFWISYCNSFFITAYGMMVSMIVAICGAYALSKARLMFGRGFNFMLTFTMWFNAGLIPTFQNFKHFGVTNRYMFIICLGFDAFNIILLRNYFSSIPSEIEEAAIVDGATEFQILLRVYVPMSKSSIITVAMFYAVSRWNGYMWGQMLLQNDDQPLIVYMKTQIAEILQTVSEGGFRGNYSAYSLQYAYVVCSIIPIIIVYPKLQKYFAAGVNVGGVKE